MWIIRGLKKKATFLLIPFWFMLVTSMAGIVIEIKATLMSGHPNYIMSGHPNYILAVISALLLILALMMTKEGFAALNREKRGEFIEQ